MARTSPQPHSRVILWPRRALVFSPMNKVTQHAHHASALLTGIDGPFGFKPAAGPWMSVRRLWISAGCMHQLDCARTTVAVLFLTPGRQDHDRFCQTHGIGPLEPYKTLPLPSRIPDMDAILAGELCGAELDDWMEAMLGPAPQRFAAEVRVEKAAKRILERIEEGWTLSALAKDLKLSPSRLRHLFRARSGITPQQLRGWFRMHSVSAQLAQGRTLTQAAHQAGFVDSAHLSRSFKRLFGLPPSRVLRPQTRFALHGDGLETLQAESTVQDTLRP